MSEEQAERKREEAAFHDRLRSAELEGDAQEFARLTANRRFYAVARRSARFIEDTLQQWASGRRVLDYGCGDGRYSLVVARGGGFATGIDISPVSVENCRSRAAAEGLADRTRFLVMDAEDLRFPDASFDAACVSGVLHHLDVDRAYAELARVLVPQGRVVALEALAHNPVITLYRRLTPHLRTRWESEHIIRMRDIRRARRYFRVVRVRFFNLATLAAVPLCGTPAFGAVLGALEAVDSVLLRVPLVREQAWMVGLILEDPIKPHAPRQ